MKRGSLAKEALSRSPPGTPSCDNSVRWLQEYRNWTVCRGTHGTVQAMSEAEAGGWIV